MHDLGQHGSLIIAMVAGCELVTMGIAAYCRRMMQALIRFFIVIGLIVIYCTDSYTTLHLGVFACVVLVALCLAIFSSIDFMHGKNKYVGIIVQIMLAASFLLLGFYSPLCQKILLILFIIIEAINCHFSFPYDVQRRYVWRKAGRYGYGVKKTSLPRSS